MYLVVSHHECGFGFSNYSCYPMKGLVSLFVEVIRYLGVQRLTERVRNLSIMSNLHSHVSLNNSNETASNNLSYKQWVKTITDSVPL